MSTRSRFPGAVHGLRPTLTGSAPSWPRQRRGTNHDAAGFASCCGPAGRPPPDWDGLPPLRRRDLARRRECCYRGPWRLPGPDSHRLAAVSFSLGYAAPLTSLIRFLNARAPGRTKVTRPTPISRVRQDPAAQLVKHTRWALLKDPARWTSRQRQTIDQLRRARHVLFRAWALKEELRDLYRLPAGHRPDAHLDAWLARAARSRIPAMLALSRTIRAHRDDILAAVELGLSNSKLEGLNSKIRLINHRGYGHHSAAALIAMIYLCCSGLTITLPTGR
jgi:transposase